MPHRRLPVSPVDQNPQARTEPQRILQGPEPEGAVEFDTDHWEVGDEEELTAVTRPFARKKRVAWGVRVWVGVVVLGALAALAWWGQKRLSPPTPPLTIVQSDPEEETAHVVEGEELTFVVGVSSALPVQYEWTLDGHRVSQGPYWSYQPAPGEGGQTAKTVTLRLTDQKGQTLEKRWQVTVLHIPHPPQVLTVSPNQDKLQLSSGATQEFHLNAHDPENEGLTYEWTVDGVAAGAQPTLPWKAQKEGLHQIRARVRNRAGLATTQEWQVTVLASPPVPEPPPLPKNTPPHLAQYAPSERALTLREQESLDFSALATDTAGESLTYAWAVDGQQVTQGDHFLFTAEGAGKHRIEVAVADQGGLKDKRRWDVFVEPLPAAPRLVMFTPYQPRFSLYPHLSRFLGVIVEVPGVVEPPLQYDWKVDGRSVAGREVFEFKNQSPGRHEVEVRVTGPSGTSVTQTWTVEVLEEQDTGSRASIWAPYLEVFDLDNAVNPKKKTITVTGKVRNIDERSAENVLVWISALDQQGQRVFRRLTLPIPQPLAPGHIAAFQTSFANDEAIVDFRVEVVSK